MKRKKEVRNRARVGAARKRMSAIPRRESMAVPAGGYRGAASRGGTVEKRKSCGGAVEAWRGEGGGGTAHGWLLHTRQLPRIQQSGRMQDADTLWIMKPSASMPVWLLLANARSLLAPSRRRRRRRRRRRGGEIYEFLATRFVHAAGRGRPRLFVCLSVCRALLASNFNCVKTTIHAARNSPPRWDLARSRVPLSFFMNESRASSSRWNGFLSRGFALASAFTAKM